MNSKPSFNAICIAQCEIRMCPPWKKDIEIMDAGTMVKVLSVVGGGNPENQSNYIFKIYDEALAPKSDVYSCCKENITEISDKAFSILCAIKDVAARSSVAAKYIKNIENVDIGTHAKLYLQFENGTQMVNSVIQFIGNVPEIGIGLYFGLELLNHDISLNISSIQPLYIEKYLPMCSSQKPGLIISADNFINPVVVHPTFNNRLKDMIDDATNFSNEVPKPQPRKMFQVNENDRSINLQPTLSDYSTSKQTDLISMSPPKIEMQTTSEAELRKEVERLKSELAKYEQSSLPPQPAPRSTEIRLKSFEHNSLQNCVLGGLPEKCANPAINRQTTFGLHLTSSNGNASIGAEFRPASIDRVSSQNKQSEDLLNFDLHKINEQSPRNYVFEPNDNVHNETMNIRARSESRTTVLDKFSSPILFNENLKQKDMFGHLGTGEMANQASLTFFDNNPVDIAREIPSDNPMQNQIYPSASSSVLYNREQKNVLGDRFETGKIANQATLTFFDNNPVDIAREIPSDNPMQNKIYPNPSAPVLYDREQKNVLGDRFETGKIANQATLTFFDNNPVDIAREIPSDNPMQNKIYPSASSSVLYNREHIENQRILQLQYDDRDRSPLNRNIQQLQVGHRFEFDEQHFIRELPISQYSRPSIHDDHAESDVAPNRLKNGLNDLKGLLGSTNNSKVDDFQQITTNQPEDDPDDNEDSDSSSVDQDNGALTSLMSELADVKNFSLPKWSTKAILQEQAEKIQELEEKIAQLQKKLATNKRSNRRGKKNWNRRVATDTASTMHATPPSAAFNYKTEYTEKRDQTPRQNYNQVMQRSNSKGAIAKKSSNQSAGLVGNVNCSKCSMCKDYLKPSDGVSLRDCQHVFCRPCLVAMIQKRSPGLVIVCPYKSGGDKKCLTAFREGEINELLGWAEKMIATRTKVIGQGQMNNENMNKRDTNVAPVTSQQDDNPVDISDLGITDPVFYCKTANCTGCWIIEEQDAGSSTIYRCPICEIYNCIKCKAIHNGMTCDEFRKKKRNRPAFEHDGKMQRQVAQQNTIAARNPDVWICEKCTCENKKTANFCVACDTRNEFKPEEYPITDDDDDDDDDEMLGKNWKCTHCTGKNLKNTIICVYCNRTDFNQKALFDNYTIKPIKLPKWTCTFCTVINNGDTSICHICKEVDYNQRERLRRFHKENPNEYMKLLDLESGDIVFANEEFECEICTDKIAKGDGIKLRGCLHNFCSLCIAQTIEASETAEVKCPMPECDGVITHCEMRSIITQDVYDKFVERSLRVAKPQIKNGFQCTTPDCKGFWIFDDKNYFYTCEICKAENCITCNASHTGMDCKEYQDYVFYSTDPNAIQTRQQLENMIKSGEAMQCPTCKIVIVKNEGCNHMRCQMCKKDFNWAPNRNAEIEIVYGDGQPKGAVGGVRVLPRFPLGRQ